jgi:hypothetical protein
MEYFPLNPVRDNSGAGHVLFLIQVRHERDPLLYYMEAAASNGLRPSRQERTLTNLRNIGIALLAIGSIVQCFAILKLLKYIIARRAARERSVPAQIAPIADKADDNQTPPQGSPRSRPTTELMV